MVPLSSTDAGFTNWFRDRCNEAGLPNGLSAHGLRKARARLITEKNGSAHAVAAVTVHKTLSEAQRYTARYVTDLATHCLHSELPPIAYRRARTLLGIGTSTFSFHFRTCHNAGTDRSFDMRHLGRPELRGPETSTTPKTISGFSCFVENIE